MKNKKNIILGGAFILVAIIFFFIGKHSVAQPVVQDQNGGTRGQFGGGKMRGGGNVFGQIISKDANSVTVQLGSFGRPGDANANQNQVGSKIVFFTDKTSVLKSVDGTTDDLAIGKTVMITGSTNPDGSVSANSIQLRTMPEIPQKQ
jgi:hypothetical protein